MMILLAAIFPETYTKFIHWQVQSMNKLDKLDVDDARTKIGTINNLTSGNGAYIKRKINKQCNQKFYSKQTIKTLHKRMKSSTFCINIY